MLACHSVAIYCPERADALSIFHFPFLYFCPVFHIHSICLFVLHSTLFPTAFSPLFFFFSNSCFLFLTSLSAFLFPNGSMDWETSELKCVHI